NRFDVLGGNEAAQVDVARFARLERFQLVIRDDHILAIIELVPAYDVIPLERLAVFRAEVTTREWRPILVEHAERNIAGSICWKQVDRNAYQPECDRAGPE